ncbi:MAG TPA: alpha/beta hydrolase domain-containing protein [Acidimicrobiia bacterium]|nr:alpha/beta hydrolase domain-containing protein [Acidimicrobiia bacterium]
MSTSIAAIGPVLDGAPTLSSVQFDLATVGYAVEEHVVTGEAVSYASPGEESGRAPFTTRIVVYRPVDAARRNGTAVVEWLNVTGGLDIPALWMATHRHLIRDGYTWVGVSAQLVGIEGGGMLPGLGLRQTAPDRYASLQHPGDAFSFDIFSQVARAVRELLRADRVIATGASQSAFYLTTYINAVDPIAAAVDGFVLQGRGGAGVPLEGLVLDFDPADHEARLRRLAGRERIREDARVPVVVVQSETDVFGSLQYLPARQPDSERFRLWEVAGGAHADTYFFSASPFDSGALAVDELAALVAKSASSGMPVEVPINSGPQMHYVLQRAFAACDRWIRDGVAPPSAERLAADGDGRMLTDDLGIARDGVRTPWVDAPVEVLSGLGQPGFMMDLFGVTRSFANGELATRYRDRDEFVARFDAATQAAVDAGFLLSVDAAEIEGLGRAGWDRVSAR